LFYFYGLFFSGGYHLQDAAKLYNIFYNSKFYLSFSEGKKKGISEVSELSEYSESSDLFDPFDFLDGTHATCHAQCGGNGSEDADHHLDDEFPSFLFHDKMVLKV